jgi:PAS domain S-box-containing protein
VAEGNPNLNFLAGGGEMGARIRAMDWSPNPLGPVESWPQSLRSAVSIMLPSKAQIALFWGEELITLYNDAYRPVFGAKHPSALGKPIREAWDELWRAGLKELFDGVRSTGDAFWAQAMPFYMERHGYLEETYFDVSYDPVRDESGHIGGVFCIVNEVTGRVVGERRLRLLRDLRGLSQQALTVSEVYRAAAEVMAGYPEDLPFALVYGTELLGRCGLKAEPPSAPPAHGETFGTLPADALGVGAIHAGPWPEPIAEMAIVPFAAPGEASQGCLVAGLSTRRKLDASYRDFLNLVGSTIAAALSAARRSEDERRRAEMLAELDRAKTAFFSNVSHEFRTPLTLMLGPVEDTLADRADPLTPAQRERLDLARRSALRLQKLVNTLLDFSRIEAGRAQASYQATDLAALTAELASNFRSAMEKAGLALEVDCPPLAEPAWVDRDMWEKIVLNLLSNAFKFTFEGSVRVSLAAQGDQIVLAVRDTGTGIPAAELPRIFERFRRVEGARSRTHEGTGIGLAFVQELARLHGGAVSVESEEGKGSTFRVAIPAGKDHLPAERIGARRTLASTSLAADAFVDEALRWIPTSAPVPEPVAGASRPRIVWADDNADMRDYVRALLAPHYDVVPVADGAAALDAIRAAVPAALITDVMMPGIDGLELVRRLRSDPATAELPVLMLSARAGEESRIEGFDAGADDYLYKPFSARELLARVASLLRAAELRAEKRRHEEARRESDRRLETLIANLPGMAYRCLLQAPWPLTFASEGVAALTGYPAAEFVEGRRTWGELVHPDDAATVEREVAAAVAEGRPFEMTYRLRAADGTVRWVLDRGRPVREGAAERAVAIEGFCLDLTRQLEAEEGLRDADRRKDEFLATLSHELRNPLAPLKNGLTLLHRDVLRADESPAILRMMERQVDHLVRLVDDLLEVTRITTGALELRRERVEGSTVVRNALESTRPLVQQRQHALHVALSRDPIWLDGDPVRLAQILSNLLNNAAKYTEPGGRIALTARVESGMAVFEVADNGAGIAPEALPRVFAMFSREDRTRRGGTEGLGIGLAIARRLAEMHGGSLQGRSDGPGLGAVFTLRLPLAERTAAGVAPAAPTARAGAATAGKRLLIVDDNQDAAASLGMLLRSMGGEVELAHSGPEALERFGQCRPDVVLLDIGMPGMDGYQVARAIRTQHAGHATKIIALTGWGQESDRRRAAEAGFDHHLVKPIDLEKLQVLLAPR